MDKLNRFVGKLRNWLPGDMDEANSDFKKQYEKGESFTDEYLAECRKSRTSYYDHNPSYKLLRLIHGKDADEGTPELDRLEKAMDMVHDKHGLHCGPVLSRNAPVLALEMTPTTSDQDMARSQPEQLLLLAA